MSSTVRVAIAVPMSDDLVRQIEAVDERVEVTRDPSLFPGPRVLGDHHGKPPESWSDADRDRFYEMLTGAEVVYGVPEMRPRGLRRLVETSDRVRWVHAVQAGAGAFVTAAGLSAQQLERVTVTTSAGVHAEPLAEFALLGMLAGAKELPRLQRDQREHAWRDRQESVQLKGARCLILGAGEIGKQIARRAQAFGMHTVGTKRQVEPVEHFDEIVGNDRLHEQVALADHVVITLPGTGHTEHMVDADLLAACKRGVVIVNVGRGSVIDEAALIDALRSGQVGYAALDVFEREPLDPQSPLWELPNVLVSPHSTALDAGEEQRVADLFCQNLRSYLDGAPMRNVIDVEAGY